MPQIIQLRELKENPINSYLLNRLKRRRKEEVGNVTMNSNKYDAAPFTEASERRAITPVNKIILKTKLTRIYITI